MMTHMTVNSTITLRDYQAETANGYEPPGVRMECRATSLTDAGFGLLIHAATGTTVGTGICRMKRSGWAS